MSSARAPFGPDYGFGLYVHWPYCARICPYCDFNVYAAKDRDTSFLLKAICDDIRAHRDRMPDHGALDSVYFGGGTPSLLIGHEIQAILDTARDVFGVADGAEVTLEANPNDVLTADLTGWAGAGVNRLSVGVQSLRNAALAFLGRDHDGDAARAAVERALKVFPNLTFDLIYARPGQLAEEWAQELEDALALGAPHLSLYELTIEAATAFGKAVGRGEIIPMEDDCQADLYELTDEITRTAGLPAYEVSNHARGPEFQSRHNQIYWNSGDWIGVGPGAHGRISVNGHRYATEAHRKPPAYIANLQALGAGWADADRLSAEAIAQELLAMGLRPEGGLDRRRVESVMGRTLNEAKIGVFTEEGWLRADGPEIALTSAGRLLADALTAELST